MKKALIIQRIVLLTFAFFFFALVYLQSSLDRHSQNRDLITALRSRDVTTTTSHNTEVIQHHSTTRSLKENVHYGNHYGWQPLLSADCPSFRPCFQSDHSCPHTCRDSPSDFPPISVPDDWVPDVTMLHRMAQEGIDANGQPWPPPLPDELCENFSVNGGKFHDENKEALEKIELRVAEPSSSSPRVLCMVYTMEEAHATKIRAIRETWGPKCDGFLAFSTASDPRLPAISIPHEGEEAYGNMWQKVRSIWKFVHEHYVEDFDYFFLGGDDLFVIPDNLKAYLSTLSDEDGIHFLGRRFKGYGNDNYFNSGGAGYALSRKVVQEFYKVMDDTRACSASTTTAMEDVMIAKCLRQKLDIHFTDTRDEEGRERFHPFAPATHYTWKPTEGDWYVKYNEEWGVKLGKDCCAPDSVSFHYIKKPAMVRHIFALIYQCPKAP